MSVWMGLRTLIDLSIIQMRRETLLYLCGRSTLGLKIRRVNKCFVISGRNSMFIHWSISVCGALCYLNPKHSHKERTNLYFYHYQSPLIKPSVVSLCLWIPLAATLWVWDQSCSIHEASVFIASAVKFALTDKQFFFFSCDRSYNFVSFWCFFRLYVSFIASSCLRWAETAQPKRKCCSSKRATAKLNSFTILRRHYWNCGVRCVSLLFLLLDCDHHGLMCATLMDC